MRSSVVAVARTVMVAAGVFAPGHLGELTQQYQLLRLPHHTCRGKTHGYPKQI